MKHKQQNCKEKESNDFSPFDEMEKEIACIDNFLSEARKVCEEYDVKYPAITARIITIRRGFFSDINDFRKVVLEAKSLIYSSIASKDPDKVHAIKALDEKMKLLVSKKFRGITLTFDRDIKTPRQGHDTRT